jgi:hypothetical protein
MADEKIALRMENGKTLSAVVVSKSAEALWVVIGEGLDNVKCKLAPTRNGLAYAGSIMGRELIFERSVKQVQADIVKEQQTMDLYRARR